MAQGITGSFGLVNRNIRLLPMKLGLGLVLPTFFMLALYLPSVVAFNEMLKGFASRGGIESMLRDPMGALWALGSSALVSTLLLWVGLLICFYCYIMSQAAVAGVLGRALREPGVQVTVGEFLRQGRVLVKPLARYAVLFFFVLVLFILTYAMAAAVISGISGSLPGGVASQTLKVMMELTAGLVFMVSLAALYALGLQGIAHMVFEGSGALRSLLLAARYLWDRPARADLIVLMPGAFILMQPVMAVLSAGAGAAGGEAGYLFSLLAGSIWLVLNVYMGIVMVAVVLGSYYDGRRGEGATSDSSTRGPHIFSQGAAGHCLPPSSPGGPPQG